MNGKEVSQVLWDAMVYISASRGRTLDTFMCRLYPAHSVCSYIYACVF
jgi:hypothetical protein